MFCCELSQQFLCTFLTNFIRNEIIPQQRKSTKGIILHVDGLRASFNILISFLNNVLLTDKTCCKFMLKYGIQNYFRQFTKVNKKNNFQ